MPEFIKRRNKGERVGALAPHNRLIDRVNIANGLTVAHPLQLHRLATGLHIALTMRDGMQFVVLSQNIEAGGVDRHGAVLDYDGGSASWVDTSQTAGYSEQLLETIADPHDGGVYLQGERHFCCYDPNSQKHLPVNHPTLHLAVASGDIDVDLTGQAAGSVALRAIAGNGAEVDAAETVDAYNRTRVRIWDGAPCNVMFHPQSRRWYVVSAYSATTMRGLTKGALAAEDPTIDLDSLTPLDGHYPIAGATTSITAHNIHAMESDDRAAAVVHWNDTDQAWEIFQLTCPS